MPQGDRILNAMAYVVVLLMGAIAGAVLGFHVAARATSEAPLDSDWVYSYETPALFSAIGALAGGIAALAFAARSQWAPTLHLTREHKEEEEP
ncbi:MAG: hypothetical protein IT365_19750 [Candidatus Hydrogenedentes bacterium]|nr:hypothetical protein [Candidatus Hydrogenedentota bacterium]